MYTRIPYMTVAIRRNGSIAPKNSRTLHGGCIIFTIYPGGGFPAGKEYSSPGGKLSMSCATFGSASIGMMGGRVELSRQHNRNVNARAMDKIEILEGYDGE